MPPTSSSLNPQIDAYIAKAQPFAQPILLHLRSLVHQACPQVDETIKWSRPFFEFKGVILGNMSAFKEHCSFGFWGEEIAAVLRQANALQPNAMGSLGRLITLKDLPPDKQLLQWLRQASAFIEDGNYTSPITARNKVVKAPIPALETPSEFTQSLQASKSASAVFAKFSPSAQREYIEWIAEAKRPETKAKRIQTAIEWIAEGKQRNWKYQTC